MNGLDDCVVPAVVQGGRCGRGRRHSQQRVAAVESVFAERHGVQVLMQQKPQLLVLLAHVVFVSPQSFSMQHGTVDAPHEVRQFQQFGHLLRRKRRGVSAVHIPCSLQTERALKVHDT